MIRAGKSTCLLLSVLAFAAVAALMPSEARATYYNVTGANFVYDGSGAGATLADPLTWDTGSIIYVGDQAPGTISIDDSEGAKTFTSSDLYIGSFHTAGTGYGTLTLAGTGTVWSTVAGSLNIGGAQGTGVLNVLNGAKVTYNNNNYAVLGSNATATATVDGVGSQVNVPGLVLGSHNPNSGLAGSGNAGTATVNIGNGGAVTVVGQTVVAPLSDSVGAIAFGTDGVNAGTLTTGSLYAAPSSLTGTGAIVTHGIVTDRAITIDSTASKVQTFTINDNVGVTLDVSVNGSNGELGAGYAGIGSLTIGNGVSISTSGGAVGFKAGSSGAVTVENGSSLLTNLYANNALLRRPYYVGNYGTGTLTIRNGSTFGNLITATGLAPLAIGHNTGSMGSVTVSASTLNAGGGLAVGSGGDGRMLIENNSTINTKVVWIASAGSTNLGLPAASGGTAVVTLDHSTWVTSSSITASPRFYVGGTGNGTLHIQNSGSLTIGDHCLLQMGLYDNTNGGGAALVTIDGYGSRLTNNSRWPVQLGGHGASSTLAITNGGVFNSINNSYATAKMWIGAIVGGTGTLSVDGKSADGLNASSFTIKKGMWVGKTGEGHLNITNGGYAHSGATLYVGGDDPIAPYIWDYTGAGSVTVDGANSQLVIPSNLVVGYSGTGLVTISNGGAVSNADAYLCGTAVAGSGGAGVGGTTSGTVTISGNASTWTNTGTIHAGYKRTATINLDGGTILANSIVGGEGGGTMSVNFNGGTLKPNTAPASTWISGAGGTNELYVKEGGAKFDTNGSSPTIALPLQHGGSSATDGGLTKLGLGTLTLSGSNTYTGWTIVSGGALSLDEIGLYDASNVRVDTGTTLDLTFSGPDTVHYLFFGGLAQTAGTYDVSNSGGFITGGGSLLVSATALQGDADLNGTVNSTDLGLLLSHYNQVGTGFAWGLGDFDANGTVNSTDLGLLLSHYNQTSAATSAVPEPSTLLLLAAGLIGLLAYAWRKK